MAIGSGQPLGCPAHWLSHCVNSLSLLLPLTGVKGVDIGFCLLGLGGCGRACETGIPAVFKTCSLSLELGCESVSVIVAFASFDRHGLHARYPSWKPVPQAVVSPSLFCCDNLVLCVYTYFHFYVVVISIYLYLSQIRPCLQWFWIFCSIVETAFMVSHLWVLTCGFNLGIYFSLAF